MSRHITSMQRSWQKEPEKFVNAAKKFKKQNTANDMFIFPSPATHRTNKNRTVVEIAQCPCMLRIPKLSPVSPLHLHCIAAAVGQVRKPGARLISCSPSLIPPYLPPRSWSDPPRPFRRRFVIPIWQEEEEGEKKDRRMAAADDRYTRVQSASLRWEVHLRVPFSMKIIFKILPGTN